LFLCVYLRHASAQASCSDGQETKREAFSSSNANGSAILPILNSLMHWRPGMGLLVTKPLAGDTVH